MAQRGPRKKFGAAGLYKVAERAATTASTTLKKVITSIDLKRGRAGAVATIPAELRTERTFGSTGTGRAKLERTGVKLQHSMQEIRPRDDSALFALTRIIEERGQ